MTAMLVDGRVSLLFIMFTSLIAFYVLTRVWYFVQESDRALTQRMEELQTHNFLQREQLAHIIMLMSEDAIQRNDALTLYQEYSSAPAVVIEEDGTLVNNVSGERKPPRQDRGGYTTPGSYYSVMEGDVINTYNDKGIHISTRPRVPFDMPAKLRRGARIYEVPSAAVAASGADAANVGIITDATSVDVSTHPDAKR